MFARHLSFTACRTTRSLQRRTTMPPKKPPTPIAAGSSANTSSTASVNPTWRKSGASSSCRKWRLTLACRLKNLLNDSDPVHQTVLSDIRQRFRQETFTRQRYVYKLVLLEVFLTSNPRTTASRRPSPPTLISSDLSTFNSLWSITSPEPASLCRCSASLANARLWAYRPVF